jgi:two-component system, sensor histidine kinase FlrB
LAIVVLTNRQMVRASNLEPIKCAPAHDSGETPSHICGVSDESESPDANATLLTSAFSEFISASSRLEGSYRQLQQEVHELRRELCARDAELSTSLAENDRIRLDLQQIVDSMPCGVLVLSRQGEVLMINPECGRLLGLEGREALDGSQAALRQISALSGIDLQYPYEEVAGTDVGQEFCILGASGKRWIEVRHRPLFYPVGRPDRVILILRDITAQKRAELERESARKGMALAEVATILAHEIRNPLGSLELFAELVEKDEEHRAQWISNLRAGIRRLSSTVNNVLTFHGSGSLPLSPVTVAKVISNAVNFMLPIAQQADVSLLWRQDCNHDRVMGNEAALHQVVLNLFSNAIRHTLPGGSVAVSLCRDAQHLVVEISDTGVGIRPDQIARIFEPGFSGNGDRTGLGLAVCRRIMTQHNGCISVSDAPNAGARFQLSLPLLGPEDTAA